MKKLVSNGAVMENLGLDSLMKEAMETHIPTVKI